LRDILKGEDSQVAEVVRIAARIDPDVLLLTDIDYDLTLAALTALRDVMARDGPEYPHIFALRPNTGLPTGRDMDGDRRLGGPRDAQAFGYFNGQGGMAILSKYPLGKAADLSGMLWRDAPDNLLTDAALPPDLQAIQRLSTAGHWIVPVRIDGRTLSLMAWHATPPVFDGPEDRNGRRNADELRLWTHLLDGILPIPPPEGPFVIIGNANLDPLNGDGRSKVMAGFLSDPRLQDPGPLHGRVTVDWPEPTPGDLRVSYVLPSAELAINGANVHWPPGEAANKHRLVWVDLTLPGRETAQGPAPP